MLAIADTPRTMSSREIAGLVDSRHDSVKRTIETLGSKGVITLPHNDKNIGFAPKIIGYPI